MLLEKNTIQSRLLSYGFLYHFFSFQSVRYFIICFRDNDFKPASIFLELEILTTGTLHFWLI
jgi:hypothetical protein